MGVKISALPADSSIGGAEQVPLVDSTTTKMVTTAALAAYSIDVLIGADAATPTTGDVLLGYRSTTEKSFTLDTVAAYAVASAWSVASAADPAVTGDLLLVERSGTVYDMDVDVLGAYVLAGGLSVSATFRSDVLDLSGLSAATLAGSDVFTVCQSTTAKKVTLTNLEMKLWTDYLAYVGGLSAVAAPVDGDKIYISQSGVAKYVTPALLATYMTSEIAVGVLATAWDAAAVDPAVTGDMLILERSNVPKTIDVDTIAAYTINDSSKGLAASSAVTPTTGDDFVLFRSGAAKLGDIDLLASYIIDTAWTSTTITSLNDSDTVLIGQSGVSKKITAANFQTYVLTGIQATVLDIDALAAATLTASDKYLVCQSGVAKTVTYANLEAEVHDGLSTYVAALADATTVVDADKFYLLNSGTAKYTTALEIVTYVRTELWAASAAGDVQSGDTFLIDRSGTKYEATVDQLETFIATDLQATILDISGLDVATLASSDLVMVCQTTTPRKVTVANLAAEVHDEMTAYVEGLDAVVTVADADYIFCTQSGTAKYVTPLKLAGYCWTAITAEIQGLTPKTAPVDDDLLMIQDSETGNALAELSLSNLWNNLYAAKASSLPWKSISSTKYTTTPASTSSITMSDTSDMAVGLPLKYAWDGTTYYGIITAVTANTSITIAGAPMDVLYPITALSVGVAEGIETLSFHITAPYDDAVQDLLATVEEQYFKWPGAAAHLATFSATNHWPDGGASQPKINLKIDGSLVSTNDSNNGIQLSGVAGTWVDNSAVAISASNYTIARGDAVEIRCTATGTDGDAECLTVLCTFIYE